MNIEPGTHIDKQFNELAQTAADLAAATAQPERALAELFRRSQRQYFCIRQEVAQFLHQRKVAESSDEKT